MDFKLAGTLLASYDTPLQPAVRSMQCSTVSQYIAGEVVEGSLAMVPPDVRVHTSPIGLILKPHCPGKFCLIVDLSAPKGSSVNDGIDPSLCSLEYVSV